MYKIFWSLGKGMVGGIFWLASITLDESTLVPVGSAVFVLLGVWSLSARLQKMQDDIKDIRSRMSDDIQEIKRRMDKLEGD